MKHTRFIALTLLLLVLSACTPIIQPSFQTLQPEVVPTFTETAQLPETGNAPASTPFTDACPIPTADSQLFMDADNGHCLLYPAGNTTVIPPYLIVVNPNGMSGDVPGDAWMQLRVEPASGRTAAQVADTWIAEAGEGYNITRSEIMVDGRHAVVVDGLPGPDPWRLVFIDGLDRIYTLFFLPWLPDADYFAQLDNLYETAIATFHVLPPATSNPMLPDLTITSAYVSMVDGNGTCLPYYGLIVTMVNQGGAPALDVFLAVTTTGQQVGVGTIGAGQSLTMPFVAKAASGGYTVIVDPQNAVIEADENNNSAVFAGPTATPPASCQPVQIETSTFTPPPFENTLTPSFTPPPISNSVSYYYFLPANSPVPQGSVVIAPDTYILAPAKLDTPLNSDPAAVAAALNAALDDPRNLWVSDKLEIAKITFNAGRADILLQGEMYGVGDVTLIAARMQILMTIFANPSVQSATVTFKGDTIGNWGISNSMEAKPADYIFTRVEIESFMAEIPTKFPEQAQTFTNSPCQANF